MYQSVNNIYLSERQIGEQCGGTVEQWNSDGGTVWWNSGTLMVEECNETVKTVMVEQCGGTFEQSWWNSVVEWWNSHGGRVWWNSGTVMVAQCRGTVEQIILEQSWWKSETMMVEQWNSNGATAEQ